MCLNCVIGGPGGSIQTYSSMRCLELADLTLQLPNATKAFAGLEAEQAMLWGGEFDWLMENVPCLEAVLSEDERLRSRSFHFDTDRKKFIVARGLLRVLLGQYLGKKASRIRFAYNAYGKPSLAGSGLEFNLSHSDNRLLFGFTTCQSIGVDIEKVRAELYADSIAQENFAPREVEVLKRYPNHAIDNFFTFWTCKEAVLKGMGKGITRELREIDLSRMVKKHCGTFIFAMAGSPSTSWRVTRLNHLPGYAVAVALNGAEKPLIYREITQDMVNEVLRNTGRL